MTTTSRGLEKLERIQLSSFEDTSQKNYRQLQRFRNVTSYSLLEVLHSCPRKLQLTRAAAVRGQTNDNVDFAMGHAVGAGIQAWLMSGNIEAAVFNAFMGWNVDYELENPRKNKSLWNAILAVEAYPEFHQKNLEDWQIYILPNGKPAIEVAFCIDFENGYKHYGHIDAILIHKHTAQLAVQENKTHGFNAVEAAVYANSMQALGYAVVVDMLAPDTRFEVFYCCYSTPSREWELLTFTKPTSCKAEALLDIQLDHAALTTYEQINFYPKRGGSCFDFMRRCQFFGDCNLTETLPPLDTLPPGEDAETVDFTFTLSQLKSTQLRKLENESR